MPALGKGEGEQAKGGKEGGEEGVEPGVFREEALLIAFEEGEGGCLFLDELLCWRG